MNPFIQKLRHGARLTEGDEIALGQVTERRRRVERGDIVPEGAEPRAIMLVLEGWICRYKQLESGKRQITSLFLPGDLCEPFGTLPVVMDHTLAALSPGLLAMPLLQAVRDVARQHSRIEEALWWALLMTEAVHREHMVSLGRRSATERLAHFFCELQMRLGIVGLFERSSCELPLTQADLADLFGLSAVHVNRSLQELKGSGLISLRGRRLTIHDVPGLRALAMFSPDYLRLHALGAARHSVS